MLHIDVIQMSGDEHNMNTSMKKMLSVCKQLACSTTSERQEKSRTEICANF